MCRLPSLGVLALTCLLAGCTLPAEPPSTPPTCAGRAWTHLPVLITFPPFEDALDSPNAMALDLVEEVLNEEPWFLLRIEGHRDHCRPESDPGLDERRAEVVRAALEARGIPRSRMFTVGYDDTRPRVTHTFLGDPCEGLYRQKKTTGTNLRVEFSRIVCTDGVSPLSPGDLPLSEVDLPVPLPERPFPED